MKTYLKLINKNYDSIILNKNDILAKQTKTYYIPVIDSKDCDELLELTTDRKVLFMSEDQFDKYICELKCVKTIERREITLFTKKGIFKAHKYVYDNGDSLMKDKDYREIKINGCNYKCSKLEDSEYNYDELNEFSDIEGKPGVGSLPPRTLC